MRVYLFYFFFFSLSIVYNKITRANLIPFVALFCSVLFHLAFFRISWQSIDQSITRCSISLVFSPPFLSLFLSSLRKYWEGEQKVDTDNIQKKTWFLCVCVCVRTQRPVKEENLFFQWAKTEQNNKWMNELFTTHDRTHHSVSGGGCLQLLQPQPPPPPHRERTPPPFFFTFVSLRNKKKKGVPPTLRCLHLIFRDHRTEPGSAELSLI